MMLKNNKVKLIISSLIILLPTILGLIFWQSIPNELPTHWGLGGEANGFSAKGFAVFGLPLILLAIQWLCVLVTEKDPKNKDQNKKMMGIVPFIIPVISLFVYGVIISSAYGMEIDISFFIIILIGLMFLVLGNYLPKCRQNYTLGIKVKWTLENEENWNATHRISGKLWVIGGVVLIFSALLPENIIPWVLFIVLIPLAIFPFIYSYAYHRKQLKSGTLITVPVKTSKAQKIITAIAIPLILILVAVLMFTGDIRVSYGDTSFTINADYYQDLTVDYSEIESIEYRENDTPGTRSFGYGSARLLMGTFKNDEFGSYTRYSYTSSESAVILRSDDSVLVLSGRDEESTNAIFEALKNKIG